MKRLTALLPLLLLLALSGCGTVDTVGEWFKGKDNATPPTPLTEIQPQLRVTTLWSHKLGGVGKEFVRLAPSFDGRNVYAADRGGHLYAFEAKSGTTLWEVNTGDTISGGVGSGEGVVAVGTSNGELILYAAESGKELWRKELSSEMLSVPRVSQGTVVAQTTDAKIFAFDLVDGEQRWVYSQTLPILTLRGTASPAMVRGGVIGGFANGKVVALELQKGGVAWETTVALPSGRSELERMVDIDGEMAVVGGVLFVGAYQARVGGVNIADGRALWARDLSTYVGLGADLRHVYVSDDEDMVWALSSREGAPLWKQDKLAHRHLSAPTPYAGYVVVGDLEGWVHWLAGEDGSFVARLQAGSLGFSTPPVAGDDALYLLNDDGTLSALRPE